MKRNIVLFVALITVVSCVSQQQGELSPKDFKAKMEANVTVLDVRTPGEFKSGHLDKAVNIDIKSSQFEKQCEQLDKSKPVLVYCLAGPRSSRANQMLRKKGFVVYELKGGISAWQEEGLLVVK